MIIKDNLYFDRKDWISPSDIRGVRTPLEFLTKKNAPAEQKAAFDIGTAFHTLVLEPEQFEKDVKVILNKELPSPFAINRDGTPSLSGKGNKEYIESIRTANPGKSILFETQFALISAMRDSVMSMKGINEIFDFKNGIIEHAFYVKYVFKPNGSLAKVEPVDVDYKVKNEYEIKVRTRPDFVHKTKFFDVDLKSTTDASPAGFSKTASEYEYDIQAAMGLDIVSACLGKEYETFLFIAVEKSEPYSAVLYDLLYEDIIDAQMIYLRRLNMIREAINSNYFKGYEVYSDNEYGMITLAMPAWSKKSRIEAKF